MIIHNNTLQLECTLCLGKVLFNLNLFDEKSLLLLKCGNYVVTAIPPAIRHTNAGIGCFADQAF